MALPLVSKYHSTVSTGDQDTTASSSSSSTSAKAKPVNVPPQFVLKNRHDRRRDAKLSRSKK